MDTEKKQGFWSRVIKDSREFDITFGVIAVFIVFIVSVTAALIALLRSTDIDPQFVEFIEEQKEILQMVLTYLFTKTQIERKNTNEDK